MTPFESRKYTTVYFVGLTYYRIKQPKSAEDNGLFCSPRAQIQYIRSKNVTRHDANNWFSIYKQTASNTANGQSKTRSYDLRIANLRSW